MSLDFGEGVDKVRIRVLVENSTDATLRTDEKFKDKVQQAGLSAHTCLAEHGLSLHIEVIKGDSVHTSLLDAGLLGSVSNNMKALQINPKKIDRTIEFLKKINPEILSAMHCSGFKFTARLMDEFADSTVLGIVGTEFNL